jgi:hypothetical protein
MSLAPLAGGCGKPRPRRKHRVLHRIVDLILNRAVARPSAGHGEAPLSYRAHK